MVVCLGGQSSAVVTQKQNETLKHTCSHLCAYFYTGTYTWSLHGLGSGPNGISLVELRHLSNRAGDYQLRDAFNVYKHL